MIAPEKYKKRFQHLGWDDDTAGRYGMIENIDDNFGLLMEKLDDWNAWDNILVIFMTDNGQAGKHGTLNGKSVEMFKAGFKFGKGSVYEGGTHVPAFWRWKGVLCESVDIKALTAHIDLFETFADLAGADITQGTQPLAGRSMLPLLENPNAEWADRKLFINSGRWAKGADPNESKHKKHGVADRNLFRDTLPDLVTLPEYFKNHGYHAQSLGKAFDANHGQRDAILAQGSL